LKRPAIHGAFSYAPLITHSAISRAVQVHERLTKRRFPWRQPHFSPPLFPSDEESFRLAVETALQDLPQNQRAVLHLKVWENLTFAQIGEALEISPHTAASRYRYALDKLRAVLRPVYADLL
jgi:RNA polymerase sigma-70 factor (ECF subfamily)